MNEYFLLGYQKRDDYFKREEVAEICKEVEADILQKLKVEDRLRVTQLNKRKLDEAKVVAANQIEVQQRKEERLRRHRLANSVALLTAHLLQ